jgi:branched-chain amino acid transport system ATP-binding protein
VNLTVDNVSRAFGGVYAVREVSLTVPTGELRAIIGPNGAAASASSSRPPGSSPA